MELEALNDNLKDKIYEVEKDLINVDQYQRRNNVEFVGIPSNVPQKELEKHVLEIMDRMGVRNHGEKICSYDVVGCHRLKKLSGQKTVNVIIRFIDRNIATNCLRKRKSLLKIKNQYNYEYLNVIENLGKRTKSLYEYCKQLRKADEITRLWTYNGVVNITFDDNDDERPTKLFHPDDINYYFNDTTNLSSSTDTTLNSANSRSHFNFDDRSVWNY